jgi:hypothetical protein
MSEKRTAKPVTGLGAFISRPTPAPPPEPTPAAAAAPARRVRRAAASPQPRGRRGSQERPTVPFRMSRRTWERVHQLALSEGVSIQRLLFEELSQGFARRGLPPLDD